MEPPRPAYYHSLRPFADWFVTGVPVLTYHKLGPRPSNVRLKGLYLSKRWFQRQLAELRAAGFSSVSLAEVCRPQTPQNPALAITFDDGFSNVPRHGLEVLSAHGYRATQFLVANLLGKTNAWDVADGEASEPLMDRIMVREWLAAGHTIGSHTLTHPRLTRIPIEQAREEIAASKKKLEDLFGVPIEHFCYPYGDCNHAIRDLAQAAGYRTASTTNFGLNEHSTSPHALRRLTARYPSRNLKALWERFKSWAKK
jgi:peptidoglycan/xylan/chitin deacetylase (PgdA/CDA1 family)